MDGGMKCYGSPQLKKIQEHFRVFRFRRGIRRSIWDCCLEVDLVGAYTNASKQSPTTASPAPMRTLLGQNQLRKPVR
jgi:hypothetical protein